MMREDSARTSVGWLGRRLDALVAGLLLTIVVLSLAQVFSRYLVGSSFSWSEELNLLLWAWLIALGAVKAPHLRIGMVVSALPIGLQIVLYGVRCVVSVGLLALLFWFGLSMVALTASDSYVELGGLSRKWLFMSITVAVVPWALVTIFRTASAITELRAGRDLQSDH